MLSLVKAVLERKPLTVFGPDNDIICLTLDIEDSSYGNDIRQTGLYRSFFYAPDTLTVGRILAINDDTEITADATPSQFNEIPVGQPVRFTAEASAGVTPLKLCWDFDASDGVQEEAVGASVEHTFSKPGRYTVTFTAKPADQANKQPRVTTMEVQVIN